MRALVLLGFLAAGCAAPRPPPPAAIAAETPTSALATAAPEPQTSGAPRVRAAVHVARPLPFDASTLGLNEGTVSITLTNPSAARVRLDAVAASFTLRREGVELPCEARGADGSEEGGTLEPGETFTLTTPLGCWTPLAGHYEATAHVTFGARAHPTELREPFAIDVVDPSDRAARPYPSVPGLYLLAGGSARTLRVEESAPPEAGYHVVVLFVNAAAARLTLPAMRVTLEVRPAGGSIPCTSEESIRAAGPLEPGRLRAVHVPVTCIKDRAGDYELRVVVAAPGAAPMEAGRAQVRVLHDPDIIVPL